ncbi:MAG: hypothetical protein HUK20_04935, partial [Fibrobacter sp.]|nr:hypothetical protein [Fibrobacter sp.]
ATAWKETDAVFKGIGNNYWERYKKMKLYGNLISEDGNIPQAILLKDSAAWLAKTANNACGIGDGGNAFSNELVNKINVCYTNLTGKNPDALYNGFLVLSLKYSNKQDPTVALSGKFILYFEDQPGDMPLPHTTDDATVMLYLKKGAGNLQRTSSVSATSPYKYFVYSEGDIGRILDNLDIQGNVIMANGSTLKDLNNGAIHYDKRVLEELVSAGVIKENPEYSKRSGGDASGAGSASNSNVSDEYFVSTSPQLTISLESQYKTRESIKNFKTDNPIAAAILVLPRVIYLPQDATGYLKDYYNVLNLNGAKEQKNASNSSCTPSGVNTISKLYDGNELISSGIYNCKYSSDTYGDMPFWVVVSGTNAKAPTVAFEKTGGVVTPGGTPLTVNLEIPPSGQSQKMTVDVLISNKPDNWTINPQPGVSLHSNFSSDADLIYTVTFDNSKTIIPIFTVSGAADMSPATVYFTLIPPNNGCNISSDRNVFQASVTGFAKVKREAVNETYCADHEKIVGSDNKEYDCASIAGDSWADCNNDLQKGEWIYPYCNNLTTDDVNNKWTCGTNLGIKLKTKNISKHCIAFVDDRTIEAKSGEEYTMYASLKRKRYTLEVGASGASPTIVVKRVGATTTTTLTPYKTENGNDLYQVYAGDTLDVEATSYGSDKFSYWKCTGQSCSDRNIYRRAIFDKLTIQDNTTLIAYFNKRDDHCFYDSFIKKENSKGNNEDFAAFCKNGSLENCIDKCNTGTHCSVSSGGYPNANWTMVYANEIDCVKRNWLGSCVEKQYTGFEPPTIPKDGLITGTDYISAPGSALSLSNLTGKYSPTVLLNRAQAGFNGTMTTKMRIPSKPGEAIGDLFDKDNNDGLILRSNNDASEYLQVNVYGGEAYSAYARVCQVQGAFFDPDNNDVNCLISKFSNNLGGNYVPLTSLAEFDLRAVLNGSTLTLTITYRSSGSQGAGHVSFNLKDLTAKLAGKGYTDLSVAAEGHEYVGLKMLNYHYKFRDVSWTSTDYNNDCWDVPRVYCSFKSNYVGGTVPLDTNVTPLVTYSSWFDNKSNCSVEYYYNGCDMDGSYYKQGIFKVLDNLGREITCADGEGPYWHDGVELKDSTYHFKEEGQHHVEASSKYGLSGYEKKASVKMQCGGWNDYTSSYFADCGDFYVGEIKSCSENVKIWNGTKDCNLNTLCDIKLDGSKIANLRDAKLNISTHGQYGDVTVKAYLIDKNDIQSSTFTLNILDEQTQNFVINVNDYVDVEGFDPQSIRGIVFEGDKAYKVSVVESSCPAVPGIGNACSATFNANGNGFDVYAPNISNTEKSDNCKVTNSQTSEKYDGACPVNGNFFVSTPDLIKNLENGNSNIDVKFTLVMHDQEGNDTECETAPVTLIKPTLGVCSVASSEITAGNDLPSFKYSMANCPTGGCKVSIQLTKDGQEQKTRQETCSAAECSWIPGNDVSSSAGTYKYKVTYGSTSCEKEVTVKPSQVNATASYCKVENNTFKASISSNGAVTAKLTYNDPLGNTIGVEQNLTNGNSNFVQNLSNLTAGSYTLVLLLNGNQACSVSHTVAASATSSSSAASSSSQSGSGNLSVTCGVSIYNYDIAGDKYFSTQNLYFMMKNNANVNESPTVAIWKDGSYWKNATLSANSNWTVVDLNTLSVGSYNFAVRVGGATENACSSSINVEKPSISCTYSAKEITLGDSITITPIVASPTCNGVYIGYMDGFTQYTSIGCSGESFTIKPTKAETYQVKVQVGGDDSINCTEEIKVNGASGGQGGSGGSGGAATNSINLPMAYDISGGLEIPQGTTTVICGTGGVNIHCCPKSDCYNGTIGSWSVDKVTQDNSPRPYNTSFTCSEPHTIITSDALICAAFNN